MTTPIVTKQYSGIATSNSQITPEHTCTFVRVQPDDGSREVIATSYQYKYVSIGDRVGFTIATGPKGESCTLD